MKEIIDLLNLGWNINLYHEYIPKLRFNYSCQFGRGNDVLKGYFEGFQSPEECVEEMLKDMKHYLEKNKIK